VRGSAPPSRSFPATCPFVPAALCTPVATFKATRRHEGEVRGLHNHERELSRSPRRSRLCAGPNLDRKLQRGRATPHRGGCHLGRIRAVPAKSTPRAAQTCVTAFEADTRGRRGKGSFRRQGSALASRATVPSHRRQGSLRSEGASLRHLTPHTPHVNAPRSFCPVVDLKSHVLSK
jgi:hypothetical protein